jgi:hypothetical protein
MSFGLFTGIIFVVIVFLFLAALHFFVEGGFKNYLILAYFLIGAMVASTCLSSAIIVSDNETHQYDLNDYVLVTEAKNNNKKYYYQLTFDSNEQIEKIEAKKVTWIFSEPDTNLDFNNILEYTEIKNKIIGTNIYLESDKEYEEFRLFIQQ